MLQSRCWASVCKQMLGQSLERHIFTSHQHPWAGVVQSSTCRSGTTRQNQQLLVQVLWNKPFWVFGAGDKVTGLLPSPSFTHWMWADLGKEGPWVRSLSAEAEPEGTDSWRFCVDHSSSGRHPGRHICVASLCVHHRYLASWYKQHLENLRIYKHANLGARSIVFF